MTWESKCVFFLLHWKLYPVRQYKKCFIYKLFSCAIPVFLKFIFLFVLEKISTVVEMEASCWINSIMILFQCYLLRSFAVYYTRETDKVKYLRCRGMSENFFLLTALYLSFSHTKKNFPKFVPQEKTVCNCLPLRPIWLIVLSWKYYAITSFYYRRDQQHKTTQEKIVQYLLSRRKDTEKRGVDSSQLLHSCLCTTIMGNH